MNHSFKGRLASRFRGVMFVGMAIGSVFLLPIHGEDAPVTIEIEKDADLDKDKFSDEKMGNGVENVKRRKFVAQIGATSTEPLTGLEIRLFVIGAQNTFQATSEKPLLVQGALVKPGINLEFGESKAIEMGEVEFRSTESRKGNMYWKSGVTYYGYWAEVYLAGKKVAEKFEGKRELLQKAMSEYQQAHVKRPKK